MVFSSFKKLDSFTLCSLYSPTLLGEAAFLSVFEETLCVIMTSRPEPRGHSYYDNVAVLPPEVPMAMCNGAPHTEVPGQKAGCSVSRPPSSPQKRCLLQQTVWLLRLYEVMLKSFGDVTYVSLLLQ